LSYDLAKLNQKEGALRLAEKKENRGAIVLFFKSLSQTVSNS